MKMRFRRLLFALAAVVTLGVAVAPANAQTHHHHRRHHRHHHYNH